VLAAVHEIKYRGENTNTTGGLKVARLQVFGTNYKREHTERLIILLTDGVPTRDEDKLDQEVDAIKAMDIRIVGLGVTDEVFTARCTLVQGAVLRSHVVCPSVCNIGRL